MLKVVDSIRIASVLKTEIHKGQKYFYCFDTTSLNLLQFRYIYICTYVGRIRIQDKNFKTKKTKEKAKITKNKVVSHE
jgi:hypothetical protein